jgi:hypothetical protein
MVDRNLAAKRGLRKMIHRELGDHDLACSAQHRHGPEEANSLIDVEHGSLNVHR